MRRMIIVTIILFTFSCTKNSEPNIPVTPLLQFNMTKVEGGLSGTTNQPVNLTVYWLYSSGCDVLDKFEESRQANIVSIKAYGHINEGICTHDAGIKTKIYNFTSTTAGTFELRFINRDNSFITQFVTIN